MYLLMSTVKVTASVIFVNFYRHGLPQPSRPSQEGRTRKGRLKTLHLSKLELHLYHCVKSVADPEFLSHGAPAPDSEPLTSIWSNFQKTA